MASERESDAGGTRRSGGRHGVGEVVELPGMTFPGLGRIDDLVPIGSAADAPVITRPVQGDDHEPDGDGGADVLAFPGVGRVDELVPLDSARGLAPDASVPEAPGPEAPMPLALAPEAPAPGPFATAITADSFWGEDSQALHQPIAAPSTAASADRPAAAAATTATTAAAAPTAPRSRRRGRLLAPIVLMFVCVLASLAIALHGTLRPAAGPSAAGVRGGASAQSVGDRQGGASHEAGHARRTGQTRASAPVPARRFAPVRVPRTVVVRPHASQTRAPSTAHSTPPVRQPKPTEPVSQPSDAEEEAAPVATTPAPVAVAPAPESAQSQPVQSASSSPTSSPASSSAAAPPAATGDSGSSDIGGGSGLPGPGGPPAP